jgi:protoporphyrinogen oxidase
LRTASIPGDIFAAQASQPPFFERAIPPAPNHASGSSGLSAKPWYNPGLPMRVAIIGAGPAGLTAAYILSKAGVPVTVMEADPRYVGGIARTVEHNGFRFDIGGHRFFSKSQEIEDLWTELVPDGLLERPRKSRILYKGQFYSYPLKPAEALWKLGFVESFLCGLSYLRARISPVADPKNLEDWVSNEFGGRLFRTFFKTYTEKVWGVNCKELSADWSAQRIKGLSLGSAIKSALLPRRRPADRSRMIKTLLTTFRYPRHGPGMMWEAAAARVRDLGGEVLMGHRVTSCNWDRNSRMWRLVCEPGSRTVTADHAISSAPMAELVRSITPPLSAEAVRAAGLLRYRDFLTVGLMVKGRGAVDDNWLYIHDPEIRAGRVQNYRSWSPELLPNEDCSCYGLEYFCFEKDEIWNWPDERLIEMARTEMARIGLARPEDVTDACVVRQPKAYPFYDHGYKENVETIRAEIERECPQLHLIGRNGMHRYDNQDRAMMTGILVARNILAGRQVYDPWVVTQDAGYQESGSAGSAS